MDSERAAPAELARERHAAAERLREVLDDRQPQPRAAELARARLVDAIEALEHALLVLGRDADPGVLDLQARLRGVARHPQRDAPAAGRVLASVVEQVVEDLAQRLLVPLEHFGPFRHVRGQGEPAARALL